MKTIKCISRFAVILLAIVLIPATGFALVDASLYGGYAFGGEIDSDSYSADVDGMHYGARAHVNLGIPMVLTGGLGLFYKNAPMEYDGDGQTGDITQETYGIDAYVQLDLAILPIYPFVRYGLAIKDEVEMEIGSQTETKDALFKSSYYGIGLAYPLLDAVVMDLQLLAEYLYTTSKQDDGVELKGNAVNLGIRLSI